MAMIAKPIIPQTRIGFVGEQTVRVAPSFGETVAVPIKHDWGPMGAELTEPELLASFAEWTTRYGDSDTEARTAIAGAFAGQAVRGTGGAGGVIPYRMGANAVRAAKTLQNTTPANAITITARWKGVRGNNYSIKIDADPTNAARDRLRLLYSGVVVETYTYVKTDIAALVAAINARAVGNITAASLITGVALATTAGVSMTGGLDGDAITSADHLAAMDGLEFQPFSVIAPANLTDGPTQAAYLAWVRALEAANRPVQFVAGGALAETIDDAITRSVALADPHVVNFGVGTYHDDLLNKDLSTAQLAPRIAGILAVRGEDRALTGAELGGLHVVGTTGPSTADAEVAVQNGVTVLIHTDSEEADLRIAKGLTTYISEADAARPRRIFEEPRFIRIMDLFTRRMKVWGDQKVIGNVPVNQDTRDAVRQYALTLIDDLQRRGLILSKAQGAIADPYVNTPVTTDDTIPFEFGWQFAYTANYLIGEGRVR